ncbi:MAG: AAA family ATPase [Patescibacteria group bacterium]
MNENQPQTINSAITLVSCKNDNGDAEHKRLRRKCGGLDVYATWNNVTFTWGPKFSEGGMRVWDMERAFFWFVNIVLFFMAVAGVVNAVIVITVQAQLIPWQYLLFLPELSYTWVGILAACFGAYRIYRYSEANASLEHIAHEQGAKKQSVELSKVMSKESWQILRAFWKYCHGQQIAIAHPIHLFAVLLQYPTIGSLFVRLGVDQMKLAEITKAMVAQQSRVREGRASLQIDPVLKECLFRSVGHALDKQLDHIEPQHLLLEVIAKTPVIQDLFDELDVSQQEIGQMIGWFDIEQKLQSRYAQFNRFSALRPKSNLNRSMTAIATPILDMFSQDITQIAASGRLTFCIGRKRVIDEVFRLAESGSTNIVLVGPEGVGKSTIIGALAERMITEQVPELFKDKRLVALSIPKLLAGATASGMVEQRLLAIRDEVMRSGNIILFIDNVHDLVGASGQGDAGLDTSELVARIMERHEIPVLATSNPVDHRRFIAGKSLGSVLERVDVPEPTPDETMAIMQSQTSFFEYKYKVYFSFKSMQKIIELADRYMYEHVFPEKALRLMEEIAVHIKNTRGEKQLITAEDVAALVSEKVNMPLTAITETESETLLNLESIIHERLVNQELAVKAVASALRRARTELRDTGRPIVNLLFLGPTGVGKTELAKTVAAVYFGAESELLRLDMSEYQNQNSLARLIGSESDPNGGYLTEGIKQKPYTVLLLDELEKAHPDILNVFLQVMDDGRLTDWAGQTVDFTNVILIATSNAGTQFLQDELRKNTPLDAIKEALIQNELKASYRPEFLNRFDNIIVFKPLSQEHIKQVAGLMLKKNAKRLQTKGITLEVTDAALTEMARAGYDPLYGARPMRRLIQDTVDDAIAKFLLTGSVSRRDTVVLDVGGKINVKKGRTLYNTSARGT